MAKFIIQGGQPLRGAIRLGGAKNASFKLMIAALLGESESRLLNLSHIGDVTITELTLEKLGAEVKHCGERTIFVYANGIKNYEVPQIAGEKTRASTLLAAVLLSRFGKAIIPLPGGCVLGARPVDRHLEALKSLGAHVEYRDTMIYLWCDELRGTTYRFAKKTHTGTEALILAAARAKGRTVIENAGQEPEIDDLISFLNKMGASIHREIDDKIVIDGKQHLQGAIHKVMPDRNEAVSYAVAALATKGDIVVENANPDHLKTFLKKIDEIGGKYSVGDYGVRFWYDKPLRATNIHTAPEPGFMTDWQPLWTVLMTQAHGESVVTEAVFSNRLLFTHQLNAMGAQISLFNPVVDDPQAFYEFEYDPKDTAFHAARITGVTPLQAVDLTVPDLRAGATLTIAALIAPGTTVLENIEHIERGYEDLDGRLQQLGAQIKRIDDLSQGGGVEIAISA